MLKVIFHGPYSFFRRNNIPSILESDLQDKQGVYLWTIPHGDKELVYYVGMTARQTFGKRSMQHLKEYLAGEYGFEDPAKLQQGKRVRIWDGLWRGAEVEEYLQKHNQLFPKLATLLKLLRLYPAPLDCEARIMERIESSIADCLYKQTGTIGNFLDEEIRYRKRKVDEKPKTTKLIYNKRILGLEKVIEI